MESSHKVYKIAGFNFSMHDVTTTNHRETVLQGENTSISQQILQGYGWYKGSSGYGYLDVFLSEDLLGAGVSGFYIRKHNQDSTDEGTTINSIGITSGEGIEAKEVAHFYSGKNYLYLWACFTNKDNLLPITGFSKDNSLIFGSNYKSEAISLCEVNTWHNNTKTTTNCKVWVCKVTEEEIIEFKYDFKKGILETEAVDVATQTIKNDLNVDINPSLNMEYSFEQSVSTTWTVGSTVGLTSKLHTDLKFVIEGEIETSIEFNLSWAKTETTTFSKTASAGVTFAAPPKSVNKITISGKRSTWKKIPFETKGKRTYSNGHYQIFTGKGFLDATTSTDFCTNVKPIL